MPTAPDKLRERMDNRFGDPISEQGPMKFLEDAGYKLTRNCEWLPRSGVTCLDDMTEEEYECLMFLVMEWDFGGLRLGG